MFWYLFNHIFFTVLKFKASAKKRNVHSTEVVTFHFGSLSAHYSVLSFLGFITIISQGNENYTRKVSCYVSEIFENNFPDFMLKWLWLIEITNRRAKFPETWKWETGFILEIQTEINLYFLPNINILKNIYNNSNL